MQIGPRPPSPMREVSIHLFLPVISALWHFLVFYIRPQTSYGFKNIYSNVVGCRYERCHLQMTLIGQVNFLLS